MNLDNLNKWLTLVANVGVLAGIIFLAIELQQNTRMMDAQINQSRTDTAISFQQSIYSDERIASIVLKVRNGEELDPIEQFMYRRYFLAFNRNQDNNLWQYQNGFLGENTPVSVRGAVRTLLRPGSLALEIWDLSGGAYTDEYRELVEEVIAEFR